MADDDFDYKGMRVMVHPSDPDDDRFLLVVMRSPSRCAASNLVAADLWPDETYRGIVLDGLHDVIRQAEIGLN